MARSVTPSLTSRFTQLIGAPDDAAHQALLDDLARQPALVSALLQVVAIWAFIAAIWPRVKVRPTYRGKPSA